MIDINLIRTNPEMVKENIKRKFQDKKLDLVDKVITLDQQNREYKNEGDTLRAKRNSLSGEIGKLMREKKIEEANAIKSEVSAINDRIKEVEELEAKLSGEIREIMLTIPNIIDESVPVGKDDSENVEIQK